jgi:hypothetical protein
MRKGTSPTFWKKYEAMQVSMIASCMPTTAAAGGAKPLTIPARLEVRRAPFTICTDSLEMTPVRGLAQ